MRVKNEHAVALGRLAAGKPKRFSASEIMARTIRLIAGAEKHRSERARKDAEIMRQAIGRATATTRAEIIVVPAVTAPKPLSGTTPETPSVALRLRAGGDSI